MTTPRVAGVVLAAGASRRLGTAKQLLIDPETGLTMVVRSAQQLREAGCPLVLVVTGHNADAIATAVSSPEVRPVFNADWEEGIGSSIGAAIRELRQIDEHELTAPFDAVLIVACDMPSVSREHLQALIEASSSGTTRVASRYPTEAGIERPGIPALFPKADWTVLGELSGDIGARDLIRAKETLSVFLRMGYFDLDTAADVNRWRAEIQPPPPSH